ncbi:hypothetical protein L484_021658 [Morus notabilis]|uniref:Uncharacterized protein n=1 Tax=Morus notabilis TaxID=981085 RepID=W9SH71_9ROSA|nr:hypothetical protein L484_021658 [Morus notabilis]
MTNVGSGFAIPASFIRDFGQLHSRSQTRSGEFLHDSGIKRDSVSNLISGHRSRKDKSAIATNTCSSPSSLPRWRSREQSDRRSLPSKMINPSQTARNGQIW